MKPGSVADKAGLQKGDILLMMDGISLSNRIHESLVTYIAEHTKLEMRVLRDDSRYSPLNTGMVSYGTA